VIDGTVSLVSRQGIYTSVSRLLAEKIDRLIVNNRGGGTRKLAGDILRLLRCQQCKAARELPEEHGGIRIVFRKVQATEKQSRSSSNTVRKNANRKPVKI
jgi:hypothetical protein